VSEGRDLSERDKAFLQKFKVPFKDKEQIPSLIRVAPCCISSTVGLSFKISVLISEWLIFGEKRNT